LGRGVAGGGLCSMDRGAVVGVDTTRGVLSGCERKMKVERVSSSAGCSF
jgi:hypothetical protein